MDIEKRANTARRINTVCVRMTEAEWRLVEQGAKVDGDLFARYIRRAALNAAHRALKRKAGKHERVS